MLDHLAFNAALCKRGWSLSDLHREMIRLGSRVSIQTLQLWRRGAVETPRAAHIATAAQALGVAVSSLTKTTAGRRGHGVRLRRSN